MCVCLNKYELASVQMALSEIDPHAFYVIQEGVRVGGNFGRHLSPQTRTPHCPLGNGVFFCVEAQKSLVVSLRGAAIRFLPLRTDRR